MYVACWWSVYLRTYDSRHSGQNQWRPESLGWPCACKRAQRLLHNGLLRTFTLQHSTSFVARYVRLRSSKAPTIAIRKQLHSELDLSFVKLTSLLELLWEFNPPFLPTYGVLQGSEVRCSWICNKLYSFLLCSSLGETMIRAWKLSMSITV